MPAARFCGGCGKSVGDRTQLPANPRNQPAIQTQHVDYDERNQVTVMFADITASYELSKSHDPETTRVILESVIEVMVEAVHAYGGTVAQILGDGLMALFGAPVVHEDHAVRACYAALDMQEAVADRDWKAQTDQEMAPQIRVGLHSGEVVISSISSDLGLDYRAVGETAHLASRMEQLAQPGTTRLTVQTAKLADGLIRSTSLGPTVIKGVLAPQETFLLTGRTDLTRFQATAARGLSPFFGRSEELSSLISALESARDGQPQVRLITGEPGVGKSRLVHELLATPIVEQFEYLQASAAAYGRAPYLAAERLLRTQLGLSAQSPQDAVVRALESACNFDATLRPHQAALSYVLHAPAGDPAWRDLDPTQRRTKTIAALRAALTSWAANKPLLLICEDLQWVDQGSAAVLESLVQDPPTQNLLVLITQRSGSKDEQLSLSEDQTLHLAPLSPVSALTFVRSLLGDQSELQTLRDRVLAITSGNPFFIEEIIRSLAESGVVTGSPGAYRAAVGPSTVSIPPSVNVVISARVDRLSREQKDLLMAAATIGDDISENLLMEMLKVTPLMLQTQLVSLQQLNMLYLERDEPLRVFGFRHALIRDVVYGRMLSARAREMHGRVVAGLERLYEGRLREQFDRLADHAYKAQQWQSSVEYHLGACSGAVSASAHRHAVDCLDRALHSLEHLPDTPKAVQAGIDVRLLSLAPLLTLGERERLFTLVREAQVMAQSISDRARLGAVYSQLATERWLSSEHDQALEAASAAFNIGTSEGNDALCKAALHNKGMVHHANGDFSQAIAIFRKMIRDFSGDRAYQRFGWVGYPSVFCRTFLASSLTFTGEFNEALDVFQDGCNLADELDHPYSRSIIREELAYCHLLMAHPSKALQVLEVAQEVASKNDIQTMIPAIAGRQASTLAELGQAERAIEIVNSHLSEQTYLRGGRYSHNFLLLGLIHARLHSGRPKLALEPLTQVLAMTEQAKERAYNASAHLVSGNVYSALGADCFAKAKQSFEHSRRLARGCGMRPLEALSAQGLSQLYRSAGQTRAADQEQQDAAQIYRSLQLSARLASLEGAS